MVRQAATARTNVKGRSCQMCCGDMSVPLKNNDMHVAQVRILAARCARSFAINLALEIRGRREDRVRAAPAVSYAIVATRFAHEHTGLAEASGLPCAMALRLIRDRPGDPAFCDTIALGQRWPPSNLTPASGRRTQTISPYVKTTLVSRDPTSTAPCPSFATMAYAPCVQKIWQNERTGGCGPTARCWN
ncbi:hypothetical protein SAMN05444050_5726 [Afipia sp. GAS231]|nr:hypothetical protein SAMN05444050_5726 [Afipia sp. GAS231]